MQIGFMIVAAVVLFFLALYAHRQITVFTLGSANVFIARAALLIVGVLFGWVIAAAEADPLRQALRFAIGFGMVHIPAAVILFIKAQRGSGKS